MRMVAMNQSAVLSFVVGVTPGLFRLASQAKRPQIPRQNVSQPSNDFYRVMHVDCSSSRRFDQRGTKVEPQFCASKEYVTHLVHVEKNDIRQRTSNLRDPSSKPKLSSSVNVSTNTHQRQKSLPTTVHVPTHEPTSSTQVAWRGLCHCIGCLCGLGLSNMSSFSKNARIRHCWSLDTTAQYHSTKSHISVPFYTRFEQVQRPKWKTHLLFF